MWDSLLQTKKVPTSRDLEKSFLPVGRGGFPFYPLLYEVAGHVPYGTRLAYYYTKFATKFGSTLNSSNIFDNPFFAPFLVGHLLLASF